MFKGFLRRHLSPSARMWIKHMIGTAKVHWCRVVMNREMESYVASLPISGMDALEISGTKWKDFGFRSYRCIGYPEYDVCNQVLPNSFDVIIAEQVFEHIMRPDRAARNVLAMLRPNGLFVISTPMLIKYHPVPLDLYRWSELGMKTLLEDAGFVAVETHSWGNRACVKADMTPDQTWTYYKPLWHSLKNDPRFPIVVWAFARKS
ncbi:MAG TPA: methyltransferase domain-containing protein [Terriglobia bacterium]|nr:methyltransferase domain-containing protein [Terriglobia bacterium]